MEVIELTLTEGTELDFQIALVDNPAIESDFMAFKNAVCKAPYIFNKFPFIYIWIIINYFSIKFYIIR